MANNEQLVKAELHYTSPEDLAVIKDELQKAGVNTAAEYDGMIEATLPLSSVLSLSEKNILMDFPEGIRQPETGGLESFTEDKVSGARAIQPSSAWLSAFKEKAASSYIDPITNTIKNRNEAGAIENDFESFPANDGGGLEVMVREEEREETALTGLYIVRLHKPLDTRFRNALKEKKITLASYTEGSQLYCYKSFLDAQQYKFLDGHEAVAAVSAFGIEQKLSNNFVKELSTEAESGLESIQLKEFEIALSDEQYREQITALINNSGQGTVTDAGAAIIRFQTNPESALLAALAGSPYVISVSPYRPADLFCDVSRAVLGIDFKNPANAFTGKDETVCIIDSGVDTNHPDIKPQLKAALNFKQGVVVDQAGHGTHVAGIICGNGAASENKDVKITGVAPGVKLVSVGIRRADGNLELPPDMKDLFEVGKKEEAIIFNLSLGRKVNSQYHLGSLSVDQFIYDNPEILVVVAAGNEGNAAQGILEYGTLGSPATAKNALTVGAISGVRTKPEIKFSWGARYPASFPKPPQSKYPMMHADEETALTSSSGPSDYNSIKPEVVAPGTFILAAKASGVSILPTSAEYYDEHYTFKTGTSMAAPFVTGMAALLREYLRKEHNCTNPSAALLKAIIVGAAHKINNSRTGFADNSLEVIGFPDFDQGFGLVNLDKLINAKTAALNFRDIYNDKPEALESRADPGGTVKSKRDYKFIVPDNAGLISITLTWTDEAAKGIQNNLQLALQPAGKNWVLGNNEHLYQKDARFGSLNKVFGQLMDKNNNTEKIVLTDPAPGKYTLRVMAQNTLSPQGYSLAIIGNITGFTESKSAF